MINVIIKFRYLFIIAVGFILINAIVFLVAGVVQCVHGYGAFFRSGFMISEVDRPGVHLLEALDYFMIALVFMIFGLGLGRLLFFDQVASEKLPKWLRINNLIDLKILLWETILLTMVIFCITHISKSSVRSWDILIFPGVILILTLALFLVKAKKSS